MDAVPAGFFPRLGEEATLDEVGVASVQLAGYAGYLDEDEPAESATAEGPLFGSLVISHLGDLKELEELRRLRHSMRERDPDLLRQLGIDTTGASPESGAERETPERRHD
jgi:hypothetical protein